MWFDAAEPIGLVLFVTYLLGLWGAMYVDHRWLISAIGDRRVRLY